MNFESLEQRRYLTGGVDRLVNDNAGGTSTAAFTQSEASVIAFDNTVVVAFDDLGSLTGGNNRITGFSRSIDGGASFTDGGALPASAIGDAGDALLARDELTGRIYLATLGFNSPFTMQVFRSDNDGASWMAPVNGSPGGGSEEYPSLAVDNFAGVGRGDVYLAARRFSGTQGIYVYRSSDGGATFSNGVIVAAPGNVSGPRIVVDPGHSVYAFWYSTGNIVMRRSVNRGLTFGTPVTVASGLMTTVNGDLGLNGVPNGTTMPGLFRTHSFPHVAVNPTNGHLYVTYHKPGAGGDRSDIFFTQSTNAGTTWSSPERLNDDATSTDQWNPSIAVSPDGTRVGVFYYSRQEDTAGNNLYRFYGRIAEISGATVTFDAAEPVSDVASLPEFGRDDVTNPQYMGDKNLITATNDAFHVVWADNRSDLPGGAPRKDPNVYYDKIPIVRNGTWTGLGDGFSWGDENNWSNNTVPTAADDVVIDVAGDPTIEIAGNRAARSLRSAEALAISGTLAIVGDGVAKVTTLDISAGGTLDLGANELIVDYTGASPLTTIRDKIATARAGGAWTGFGITSSAAKNATPKYTTLGLMEATEYQMLYGPGALFVGQPIDDTAVLVKYTYYGDSDFNGVVNFDDYGRTDAGFNNHRSGWLNGDFDGNGSVNFDDYALIDLAFRTQDGSLRPGAIPEPRAIPIARRATAKLS